MEQRHCKDQIIYRCGSATCFREKLALAGMIKYFIMENTSLRDIKDMGYIQEFMRRYKEIRMMEENKY